MEEEEKKGAGMSRQHSKWFRSLSPLTKPIGVMRAQRDLKKKKKEKESCSVLWMHFFYLQKWGSLASVSFTLIPSVIIASLYSHLYNVLADIYCCIN